MTALWLWLLRLLLLPIRVLLARLLKRRLIAVHSALLKRKIIAIEFCRTRLRHRYRLAHKAVALLRTRRNLAANTERSFFTGAP
jgi:hypothetical protein